MENYIIIWIEEQSVWQVVTKLDGPYKVTKVIFGNPYLLETLLGERLTRAINGRYLKKVFSKCLSRSLSALQAMADTCIALRTKMADVYIALSH